MIYLLEDDTNIRSFIGNRIKFPSDVGTNDYPKYISNSSYPRMWCLSDKQSNNLTKKEAN